MDSPTPPLLIVRKRVTHYSYILSLLLIAAWGHAEENRSFQEVTLNVLGQQLQGFGSATSREIVERIAQESGLTASEVRGKLLGLLDEFEAQRQEKTEIWNDFVSRRSESVSAKQTEKFLEELGKSLRKGLSEEGDYLLKSLVARASRKAKMLTYEGEDFLLKILGPEGTQRDKALLSVDLPEEIGILIEGHKGSSKLADRLISESEYNTTKKERESLQNIHVSLTTALVRELPRSEYVKWAVGKADSQLNPDCLLNFEVRIIPHYYWDVYRQERNAIIVDMALEHLSSKTKIYSHCLAAGPGLANSGFSDFADLLWTDKIFLDSMHKIDEITPDQVARLIRESLDEFLVGDKSGEMAGFSMSVADAELTAAERFFDEGEWDRALQKLQELLKEDQLMHHQHIRALRTLGKLHLLLGDEDLSVLAYQDLMEIQPLYFQQPSKLLRDLGFTQEEAPELLKRIIGRSSMEVIEKTQVLDNMITARRLMTRSRGDAFLRSVALPGWGQRYMGHHRRGNVLLTAAMYSLVFAAADNSDHSRGLAAGIWSVNILDAIFVGPNIASSP